MMKPARWKKMPKILFDKATCGMYVIMQVTSQIIKMYPDFNVSFLSRITL